MNYKANIAQIEQQELELRGRWVALKLKLTDWLEETLKDLPYADDYKGVKCIVDSINQLEKLIGSESSTPAQMTDQMDARDRTKSILDKLPTG